MKPSVFVQISSYVDYELARTIVDAARKSQVADLHFGVHTVAPSPVDVYVPASVEGHKVSHVHSEAPTNIGVGAGRHAANRLYAGEDFYFQIDSHMRFRQGWDEFLIWQLREYRKIGIARPLLTAYPSSYSYTLLLDEVLQENPEITQIVLHNEGDPFIPRQEAAGVNLNCVRISRSVSAALVFTSGEFSGVAPNPDVAFWGEEFLMAARAYTHGYVPLLPSMQFVHHLYYNHNAAFVHNNRRLVWMDYPDEWAVLDVKSKETVRRILRDNVIGEGALGSARPLTEFWDFCGINPVF